jgi:hypothetical protein
MNVGECPTAHVGISRTRHPLQRTSRTDTQPPNRTNPAPKRRTLRFQLQNDPNLPDIPTSHKSFQRLSSLPLLKPRPSLYPFSLSIPPSSSSQNPTLSQTHPRVYSKNGRVNTLPPYHSHRQSQPRLHPRFPSPREPPGFENHRPTNKHLLLWIAGHACRASSCVYNLCRVAALHVADPDRHRRLGVLRMSFLAAHFPFRSPACVLRAMHPA